MFLKLCLEDVPMMLSWTHLANLNPSELCDYLIVECPCRCSWISFGPVSTLARSILPWKHCSSHLS